MSFRLSHIHDYHRFVAIDLGLYRVRAGIYDVSDGILTNTGFSSVRQSRKNWIDGLVADIGGIAESIERSMIQAGQKEESLPDDIIMSFPSRAFVSDTITTQYTRADSLSALTMHEIDDMIARIEKESYTRAHTKCRKQYGVEGDDLRLISSTIISISVDGRKVTSPIGFTGGRVRLTVLNVFVPASEFNMIRSILSRLGKRAISLIPAPLILPKLIEKTDISGNNTCLVDIGYSHTTVTILSENEIIAFETFAYGSEILMDMISQNLPHASPIQIENIICTPSELSSREHSGSLQEFLGYIVDMMLAYFQMERIDIAFEHLLLHGNIFENSEISRLFTQLCREALGYEIVSSKIYEHTEAPISPDQTIISGLALMASELLLTRRDPLVRIMRYVLYQYE